MSCASLEIQYKLGSTVCASYVQCAADVQRNCALECISSRYLEFRRHVILNIDACERDDVSIVVS